MKKNKIIFTILLISISINLRSQNIERNPFYLSFKPQYGFVIPHSKSIKDISNKNPFGAELDAAWHLLSTENFKKYNCYSRAGFSLSYINYNYPDILGSSLNLTAFAEPFFNYKGFVNTSIRFGAGFSYLNSVFHPQNNPLNLFFSSPISFIVNLDLNISKYISNNWFLMAYFKYNHISNGGIKEPNKGMNFPTYGIGAGYSFNKIKFSDINNVQNEKPFPYNFSAHAFGTLYNTAGEEGLKGARLGAGFLLKANKQVSKINAVNTALEIAIDNSVKDNMDYQYNPPDSKQLSFLLGHDFVFGIVTFSQYWGTYLYAPFYNKQHEDKLFYQRYSLSFELFDNFSAGVSLKAHGKVAKNFNLLLNYDFLEI